MSLTQPYWLLALILIPLVMIAAALAAHRYSNRWGQLVSGRLRQHLIRGGNPIPRWLAFGFLLAASILIILSMTGPRADGGKQAEKSVGRNLLLALDLSRSMRVQDVQPDRLSLAKLVILELLESMPSDRIGLVGFAGEPYLYAPLTIDHSAVQETVEQIDETWPTLGGSDLGSAIRLGIETLKKTGQDNNAMVILTDGEMHKGDLDQMITEAREAGVYLITIGIGTEDGGYVPGDDFPGQQFLDGNSNPVLSRLDADSLIQLSQETNGSFIRAGSGADIPNMVKTAISGLETFEIEGRERKVYIEFYQWLVLPAILMLMASLIAGTRWRALTPLTSMSLLILVLSTPQLMGQEKAILLTPQEQEMERFSSLANQALLEGRRARYRLGEAGSAYRLQQWNRASHAYSQALRTDSPEVRTAAHHGLGNTLFQKGWLNFIDQPYTSDLESIPGLKRFEQAARAKLALLKLEPPSDEDKAGEGYKEIKQTILDWSDGVRHYDSVLKLQPEHQGAIQNKELTLAYLRKLQELLIEDEQKTQDQIPPEPNPNQREGNGDSSESEQPGDQDPNRNGSEGDDPQNSPNGDPNNQGQPDPNRQGEPDPDGNPNGQPREGDPNNQGEPDPDAEIQPGETPEEHARRRLRENADSEKGPMTPGRIHFRRPEKDW